MTNQLTIVGGGINGLSAAFHAARRGLKRIALVDRFQLGHNRGSSHDKSRVTRSAYVNQDYVSLMQVAHESAWPEMASVLDRQLIYPCDGCFFGPPGSKYDSYASAVNELGVDCVEIPAGEARKRYPAFRFDNTQGVLVDKTAGLVAAEETMSGLTRHAREHVDIIEDCRVTEIDLTHDPIRLETESGEITTEALIVTAGPWVRQLVPQLQSRVTVARQTIGYAMLDMPEESHRLGSFPVWGYLGGENTLGAYGLPEFDRPGMKVAKHVIRGRDDNPDNPSEPSAQEIDELKSFVAECFAPDLTRFVDIETCHYTNTIDEDYIIDHHPDNDRCVVGSGFSGHGFKLGPVTGRALVDIVIDGRPTDETFRESWDRFRFVKDKT